MRVQTYAFFSLSGLYDEQRTYIHFSSLNDHPSPRPIYHLLLKIHSSKLFNERIAYCP